MVMRRRIAMPLCECYLDAVFNTRHISIFLSRQPLPCVLKDGTCPSCASSAWCLSTSSGSTSASPSSAWCESPPATSLPAALSVKATVMFHIIGCHFLWPGTHTQGMRPPMGTYTNCRKPPIQKKQRSVMKAPAAQRVRTPPRIPK